MPVRPWLLVAILAVTMTRAEAQDATSNDSDRPKGLPPAVSWTFNFDAGWGGFGFGHSLFNDPREGVRQDYGERWMEGYVKPAINRRHMRPGVTDHSLAAEIDAYADWKINSNFTASFVAAFADPRKAVEQSISRTQSFRYGMVFLAYSY